MSNSHKIKKKLKKQKPIKKNLLFCFNKNFPFIFEFTLRFNCFVSVEKNV